VEGVVEGVGGGSRWYMSVVYCVKFMVCECTLHSVWRIVYGV
jgi:hypothetical protein